ncbi:hypothetical protein O3M35_008525 [Rhynocoris fuscipes]|uniref:CHHC U11-48K-type domain-containing protein n=1 Tax=Rhynocoris fuscipes TaxID=488301 RepID=A0AAW1D8Y3_9HEMI
MINAGEPVMVCPYNKAHSIIQSRMQFHLAKCRLQHPKSEKVTCPYNSTHVVPKVELEFHESVCAGRYLIDSFLYKVGNTRCPVEPVPINAPAEMLAPDSENWDAEPPCPPVLATVQMTLEQKPVFVSKVGASKSVRKAHRLNERLRYQRVCEDEALKKKKANENVENSLGSKEGFSHNDPNVPSCSSAIKKTPLVEPNVPSSSSAMKKEAPLEDKSTTIIEKEEQKSGNDRNDDFEVVSYKKNQGRKAKQTQQPGVRYPTQNNTNKNVKEDEVLNQMSQLKINGHQNNKKVNTAYQTQTENGSYQRANSSNAAPPVGNAWDKSLNIGGRGNTANSRSLAMDEFPSLPISGRGRGLFLLNRAHC